MNNENHQQDNEGMNAAQSFLSARKEKKEQEKEATKHLATTAGKGAASYFGGPIGGTVFDATSKTKQGDKALDKAATTLNKVPGVGKAAQKLEDSGLTNLADQAVNAANMKGNPSAHGADSELNSFFSKVNQRKANQGMQNKLSQESNDTSSQNSSPFSPRNSLKEQASNLIKPSILDDEANEDSAGSSSTKKVGKGLAKMTGALFGVAAIPFAPIIIIVILIAGILGVFFTTTATSTIIGNYSVEYLISEKWGETLKGIEVTESMYDDDQIAFVNRVIAIAEDYRSNNKSLDPHLISATQYVISQYNNNFSYNNMTYSTMEELADLMFDENGIYSESLFRENLESIFLPEHAGNTDAGLYPTIVDEIFEYVDNFKEFALDDDYQDTTTGGGDICTYVAPGAVNSNGNRVNHPINATDIQVELLETGMGNGHDYGGTSGKPMEGVDLVPFEEYSAGVQQEIGSGSVDNALRAQIVASRSYALARGIENSRLFQRNNQWILQMTASTQDQVYCSSYLGCSSNKTTSADDACQWGMIYPGTTGHGTVCQQPLPAGHILFQLEKEMAGKVLVDSEGYIIFTSYGGDVQNTWQTNGSSQSYTQMLLATYKDRGAVEVKQMQCTSAGSGDYREWKQYDQAWGSIPLSPSTSTLSSVGCLVTSIAKLIAKSGVATNVDGEFNPGTFAQALSKVDTFSSTGELTSYDKVTLVAPDFHYVGDEALSGDEAKDVDRIQELLDQGYYIIAQVTTSEVAKHFVAIDTVSGNRVKIMDPGFDETDLFEAYDSNRLVLFQKGS